MTKLENPTPAWNDTPVVIPEWIRKDFAEELGALKGTVEALESIETTKQYYIDTMINAMINSQEVTPSFVDLREKSKEQPTWDNSTVHTWETTYSFKQFLSEYGYPELYAVEKLSRVDLLLVISAYASTWYAQKSFVALSITNHVRTLGGNLQNNFIKGLIGVVKNWFLAKDFDFLREQCDHKDLIIYYRSLFGIKRKDFEWWDESNNKAKLNQLDKGLAKLVENENKNDVNDISVQTIIDMYNAYINYEDNIQTAYQLFSKISKTFENNGANTSRAMGIIWELNDHIDKIVSNEKIKPTTILPPPARVTEKTTLGNMSDGSEYPNLRYLRTVMIADITKKLSLVKLIAGENTQTQTEIMSKVFTKADLLSISLFLLHNKLWETLGLRDKTILGLYVAGIPESQRQKIKKQYENYSPDDQKNFDIYEEYKKIEAKSELLPKYIDLLSKYLSTNPELSLASIEEPALTGITLINTAFDEISSIVKWNTTQDQFVTRYRTDEFGVSETVTTLEQWGVAMPDKAEKQQIQDKINFIDNQLTHIADLWVLNATWDNTLKDQYYKLQTKLLLVKVWVNPAILEGKSITELTELLGTQSTYNAYSAITKVWLFDIEKQLPFFEKYIHTLKDKDLFQLAYQTLQIGLQSAKDKIDSREATMMSIFYPILYKRVGDRLLQSYSEYNTLLKIKESNPQRQPTPEQQLILNNGTDLYNNIVQFCWIISWRDIKHKPEDNVPQDDMFILYNPVSFTGAPAWDILSLIDGIRWVWHIRSESSKISHIPAELTSSSTAQWILQELVFISWEYEDQVQILATNQDEPTASLESKRSGLEPSWFPSYTKLEGMKQLDRWSEVFHERLANLGFFGLGLDMLNSQESVHKAFQAFADNKPDIWAIYKMCARIPFPLLMELVMFSSLLDNASVSAYITSGKEIHDSQLPGIQNTLRSTSEKFTQKFTNTILENNKSNAATLYKNIAWLWGNYSDKDVRKYQWYIEVGETIAASVAIAIAAMMTWGLAAGALGAQAWSMLTILTQSLFVWTAQTIYMDASRKQWYINPNDRYTDIATSFLVNTWAAFVWLKYLSPNIDKTALIKHMWFALTDASVGVTSELSRQQLLSYITDIESINIDQVIQMWSVALSISLFASLVSKGISKAFPVNLKSKINDLKTAIDDNYNNLKTNWTRDIDKLSKHLMSFGLDEKSAKKAAKKFKGDRETALKKLDELGDWKARIDAWGNTIREVWFDIKNAKQAEDLIAYLIQNKEILALFTGSKIDTNVKWYPLRKFISECSSEVREKIAKQIFQWLGWDVNRIDRAMILMVKAHKATDIQVKINLLKTWIQNGDINEEIMRTWLRLSVCGSDEVTSSVLHTPTMELIRTLPDRISDVNDWAKFIDNLRNLGWRLESYYNFITVTKGSLLFFENWYADFIGIYYSKIMSTLEHNSFSAKYIIDVFDALPKLDKIFEGKYHIIDKYQLSQWTNLLRNKIQLIVNNSIEKLARISWDIDEVRNLKWQLISLKVTLMSAQNYFNNKEIESKLSEIVRIIKQCEDITTTDFRLRTTEQCKNIWITNAQAIEVFINFPVLFQYIDVFDISLLNTLVLNQNVKYGWVWIIIKIDNTLCKKIPIDLKSVSVEHFKSKIYTHQKVEEIYNNGLGKRVEIIDNTWNPKSKKLSGSVKIPGLNPFRLNDELPYLDMDWVTWKSLFELKLDERTLDIEQAKLYNEWKNEYSKIIELNLQKDQSYYIGESGFNNIIKLGVLKNDKNLIDNAINWIIYFHQKGYIHDDFHDGNIMYNETNNSIYFIDL